MAGLGIGVGMALNPAAVTSMDVAHAQRAGHLSALHPDGYAGEKARQTIRVDAIEKSLCVLQRHVEVLEQAAQHLCGEWPAEAGQPNGPRPANLAATLEALPGTIEMYAARVDRVANVLMQCLG
jgi:hypothetical protein